MFSINILWFMSNFSFKGYTLYRLIPSREIDLFIPPDSLMGGYNITGHRRQDSLKLVKIMSLRLHAWIPNVMIERVKVWRVHCPLFFANEFSAVDGNRVLGQLRRVSRGAVGLEK